MLLLGQRIGRLRDHMSERRRQKMVKEMDDYILSDIGLAPRRGMGPDPFAAACRSASVRYWDLG